jgi:hypothetical protein
VLASVVDGCHGASGGTSGHGGSFIGGAPSVAPTSRHLAFDLGVLTRMPVAQLHPANEADPRFLKRHRSCWKRGLWSARFTNAYCRRPSAPPRKMTKDPVQCGGQAAPVPMSVFSRHVSIVRLLSLGYESSGMSLQRLGSSPVVSVDVGEQLLRGRQRPGASAPSQPVVPRPVYSSVYASFPDPQLAKSVCAAGQPA